MAVVAGAGAGNRAVNLGATILQLRAPDLTTRRLEEEARRLVRDADVPVLVSARCDVALAVDAAGVNLPERDIGPAEARRLLGGRLVGRSVHSLDAAREAEGESADFVIFGPVWPSESHPGRPAQGVDALAAVARSIRIPVIAIGGLTRSRVNECLHAGAAGFAGISIFQ